MQNSPNNNQSNRNNSNQYQQINYYRDRMNDKHDNAITNGYENVKQIKSDLEYFNSLQHYKPIFYSGQGSPYFLENQHWGKSLGCIIFLNVIFIICLLMFLLSGNNAPQKQPVYQSQNSILPSNWKQQGDNKLILGISIACIFLINFSYFLCQFMNPGIRNPCSIPQQELEKDGRKYCQSCNNYRTGQMNHCKQCGICVWGLDHHCGFFNKCIAGWQKWAFYTFLTSLFVGFLVVIVCMGLALSFQ